MLRPNYIIFFRVNLLIHDCIVLLQWMTIATPAGDDIQFVVKMISLISECANICQDGRAV